MNNKVNEVLEKIRTICDLKKLEFGCELLRLDCEKTYRVITDFGFGTNTNSVWVASPVRGSFAVNWKDTDEVKKSELEDSQEEKWKIIGLPVQLNHLLLALNKYGMPSMLVNRVNNIRFETADSETPIFYSLEKSVEDNLHSNPELCSWIHGVIIGKE